MTSVVLNQEDARVSTETYSYSSHPRVLPNRKRYQEHYINNVQEGPINYGNLMYDRRVVRGNTYAMQLLSWSPEPAPAEIKKRYETHKKMLEQKERKKENEIHAPKIQDIENRSDVQTELYLEEILDRIIEVDMECQTDAFIKRLPSPVFIPQKTGVDVSTQIEEGELFNFDIEVKPMLQVLVGKTLEQALLEVMEEEDLSNLRAHQYAYQELRNAELAEVQRLEEKERRHREEKEHRMAKEYEIQVKGAMVSQKAASRAFALQYLADLIPSVFFSLRNKGFFYDEVQNDIEKGFLPYVMGRVENRLQKKLLGRIMTDYLINEVTKKRLNNYKENQLLKKSGSNLKRPLVRQ
ncbi:radial spoke head protein 3 homolog isoform X2 [Crotalus tigris]|uniref:radial spoke head protein 3 homolog isoform X2 n=1 Tax=Crotalus tigris TaxID=88082 RepID=UPI00192F23D8|nr:radial spoke head protein 3 homolog isoform X2 [Crotalus tigris]XP_039214245.1 radial spoke head protein 3 homolog isoform X2 [Crotalus tigris]XP_039214246.1 radial spoke head protein 3 homolog isoform X2 [Crotalus tigris]